MVSLAENYGHLFYSSHITWVYFKIHYFMFILKVCQTWSQILALLMCTSLQWFEKNGLTFLYLFVTCRVKLSEPVLTHGNTLVCATCFSFQVRSSTHQERKLCFLQRQQIVFLNFTYFVNRREQQNIIVVLQKGNKELMESKKCL